MYVSKLPTLAVSLILLLQLCSAASGADVLKGGVEQDQELHRLQRPASPGGAALQGEAGTTRLARPSSPMSGLIDSSAFSGQPLNGAADSSNLKGGVAGNGLRSGVVQDSDFADAPKNFDLGADRGSRELVLAWEKWHHQLSQVIYERWSARANVPGKATVRVTVTKDHQIRAQVLDSRGGPGFEEGLMDAIVGINGDPGLTFPSGSQRQQVSFEADYIASSNVTPGFNWVHNDYEKLHQGY